MISRHQKHRFITFAMGMYVYIFLKTFFMYATQIPIQTKVHFKNLQFLAVTYDMGFLSFAFDVVKTAVFFPLFKQFIETEMTWSQPIIVREYIFKNQNLCFASR